MPSNEAIILFVAAYLLIIAAFNLLVTVLYIFLYYLLAAKTELRKHAGRDSLTNKLFIGFQNKINAKKEEECYGYTTQETDYHLG